MLEIRERVFGLPATIPEHGKQLEVLLRLIDSPVFEPLGEHLRRLAGPGSEREGRERGKRETVGLRWRWWR